MSDPNPYLLSPLLRDQAIRRAVDSLSNARNHLDEAAEALEFAALALIDVPGLTPLGYALRGFAAKVVGQGFDAHADIVHLRARLGLDPDERTPPAPALELPTCPVCSERFAIDAQLAGHLKISHPAPKEASPSIRGSCWVDGCANDSIGPPSYNEWGPWRCVDHGGVAAGPETTSISPDANPVEERTP